MRGETPTLASSPSNRNTPQLYSSTHLGYSVAHGHFFSL